MSPSLDTRENREFATEIKFLVTPDLAGQIREWARGRLAPDPYASGVSGDAYQINSLYFDTAQFDVFHRRSSFGRSKYRIRRYGEGRVGFLERKLKTRGLLTKRRSIVKLEELNRLTGAETERGWGGFWFHQRLLARRLAPVCQITYGRIARVAMSPYGPIRLTLDEDLVAIPANQMAFRRVDEGMRLLENQCIVEMKYRFEMPLLFKLLAEEFGLNPQALSKYRLAMGALKLVPETAAQSNEQLSSDTSPCLTS